MACIQTGGLAGKGQATTARPGVDEAIQARLRAELVASYKEIERLREQVRELKDEAARQPTRARTRAQGIDHRVARHRVPNLNDDPT